MSRRRTSPLATEKARTLMEAFDKALAIIGRWRTPEYEPSPWFRGVKSRDFHLTPGAYRRDGYDEFQPLQDLQQQGVRYANLESRECWSNYYVAQHYGVPTRLLDWTDSFSSALFFALDSAENGDRPCVWVLEPAELNQVNFGWPGLYIPEGRMSLDIWLPSKIRIPCRGSWTGIDGDYKNLDNELPIAIYPRQDNPRMQVQKSLFTVHGRDRRPLDEIIRKRHMTPEKALARIDLIIPDKSLARQQLRLLGVTRSSVYPDLENYVKDLRDSYGW